MLEEIDLFAEFFIAVSAKADCLGCEFIASRMTGLNARAAGEIDFPEPAYSAHSHANRNFESDNFRYAYQSLVTPSSVYEYDVTTATRSC